MPQLIDAYWRKQEIVSLTATLTLALFRGQMLSNQGAVERSTAAVTRTERLAVETENIGNEITTELGWSRDHTMP